MLPVGPFLCSTLLCHCCLGPSRGSGSPVRDAAEGYCPVLLIILEMDAPSLTGFLLSWPVFFNFPSRIRHTITLKDVSKWRVYTKFCDSGWAELVMLTKSGGEEAATASAGRLLAPNSRQNVIQILRDADASEMGCRGC